MFKKVIFGILTIGMLTGSTCDPQVMEDVLNTVIGTTITEQEAANGLKEALVQGATNGSDLLSVVNGYLGNPQVKIPFLRRRKN